MKSKIKHVPRKNHSSFVLSTKLPPKTVVARRPLETSTENHNLAELVSPRTAQARSKPQLDRKNASFEDQVGGKVSDVHGIGRILAVLCVWLICSEITVCLSSWVSPSWVAPKETRANWRNGQSRTSTLTHLPDEQEALAALASKEARKMEPSQMR